MEKFENKKHSSNSSHASLESSTNTNLGKKERRNSLKKLVVGSTVIGGVSSVSQWKKPLINSVILPAHAQTSVVCSGGSKTFTANGTFVIPQGCSKINVVVNGAGGGGGDYNYLGGAGESIAQTFAVTPGKSYPVTIGYGGQGGDNDIAISLGGAGFSSGSNAEFTTAGGGGGSSHFISIEASGGGGAGGEFKGSVGGMGGGPNGGSGGAAYNPGSNAGNGAGASGGAGYGVDGSNGSVVINY